MVKRPDFLDWHPVPTDVDKRRLQAALEMIFQGEAKVIEVYLGDIPRFNGLCDWAALEKPWALRVLTLRYGIGHGAAAAPHDTRQIAGLFDPPRTLESIQITLNQLSGKGVASKLRAAHVMLQSATAEARRENPYRDVLPYHVWRALAEAHIFSVTQLRRRSTTQVKRLRGMGPGGAKLIRDTYGLR